jgi:type I restriction enzyme S subunit
VSFPRYPAYKDSGVEWLGEVPEHWAVVPLKTIATVINGYPFDSKLFDPVDGFPLVRIRDLNQSSPDTYYKGEFVQAASIDNDDVLIGMDGDFNVGRWLGEVPALLNQRMCCVRSADPLIARYLRYVLPAPLRLINDITYSTTVKHLSSSDVLGLKLAVPRVNAEVEKIATFLDRETAKIDALIAEQQRLIELLQEKRQAVISHAVTKGLNPDAPMKDSGVEWLGEVPEHWAISPIKYLARVGNGSTPNRDNSEYWADDGFPWLNSSVVNKAEVLEAERFVTKLALKECHLPIVEPPAALVGITGQGRTRGMAAQLMFTATVNQHVAFIKPSTNRITVDYLLRVLEASYDRLRLDSEGSGSTKGAITC